jgi:aminocarboxymuconate-semialdehyde decarboxylase
MTEAFDVHAHVIVPELLRGDGGERWRPRVWREAGRQRVELDGRTIASAVDEFVDVDAVLAGFERREVGGALLCPWVPLLYPDADPQLALERCRIQNDGLARLRARRPDRIAVLGAIPLQDPELAAEELRALSRGGEFAGVEVTASVAGEYLGEPRFEPFWAAAEELDALVFVHPTTRAFSGGVFEAHHLWNLVGNPFETTIAAAQLVLGGTRGRHPGVRILLAHGGGAIAALAGRIAHGLRTVAAASDGLRDADATPVRAEDVLSGFLFDSVTHDPELLRQLVERVGSERVLLGSDHPFDMGDGDPVGTVRAAGLGRDAERAVLCGNARRELKLAVEVPAGG